MLTFYEEERKLILTFDEGENKINSLLILHIYREKKQQVVLVVPVYHAEATPTRSALVPITGAKSPPASATALTAA
jgi:hypothetical protein